MSSAQKYRTYQFQVIIYIHTYRPYSPGTSNIQEPPQSVYLLPNEAYTITCQHDDNGKVQYVARLLQLLPDVIKENSPMKDNLID